jgi:hypothetical protein
MDGTVVVQVVKSGVVNGIWRSMQGRAKRSSTRCCEIIRFDKQGRIAHEKGS